MNRKNDYRVEHKNVRKTIAAQPETFAAVWSRITGGKRFTDDQRELDAKRNALSSFWPTHIGPDVPVPEIVPSPKTHHYRTTSKRKAVFERGTLNFSMGYTLKKNEGVLAPEDGADMEDELHGVIYDAALQILRKPHYVPLAKALNFCIVRGGGKQACVILNVFRMSADVVRKAKMFADEIAGTESRVNGVFLYFDETRSEYYFEAVRPRSAVSFKKLRGSSMLALELPGFPKLLYPPTVFSQVNESILPAFIRTAMSFAKLTSSSRFVDLYCGYGPFAFAAAPTASSVIGIDFEGPSIHAARENSAHLFPGKNIRFEAAAITPDSLAELLPPPDGDEVILLDPPRSGTADGVISGIAERHPARVISIYCGVDQMAKEFRIWCANGFQPETVRCFDMFPASPNLETMILWRPAAKKRSR